jgi:cell wall-associated NlpC family hydrolase
MRRALVVAVLAASCAAPAGARNEQAKPPSWAQQQIQLLTAKGVLGTDAKAFRPDDPITQGELAAAISAVTGKDAPVPADPAAPVTIAQLDSQLVRGLGLRDVARQFADGIRAAGLMPPSRFGTEVVARLLGLRTDHSDDTIEPAPADPATRAEAAWSLAHILGFDGWELDWVRKEAATFAPPPVEGAVRSILQSSIDLIGYPYVWGGTSELPQQLFGKQTVVNGGFDCSGFIWRVYKLEDYGIPGLDATLRGRTTAAMSGEVKKPQRIALADLEAADVLFFGAAGPKTKPAEIDHAGIYLGGGWFIQSSGQGVALAPLDSDWYAKRFAWARRPLAEAQST